MTLRTNDIDAFVQKAGWANARRSPLAGDASSRRYMRLHQSNGASAILMDAPPDSGEDIRPFLRIAAFLTDHQFSAPAIHAASEGQGLILMEDLGHALFAPVIQKGTEDQSGLYCAATDVLMALHQFEPPESLTVLDSQTLLEMTDLAFTWYSDAPPDAAIQAFEQFKAAFQPLLDTYLAAPSVLVLRDYHAENLIWLPERKGIARVGLLDFQDAVLGHPEYDLVSMLQDARRDVPDDIVRATCQHYLARSGADLESFEIAYHLLGLQRNLRILGVFARLCIQAGKPHYVDLIPRVYAHVLHNLKHPKLQNLAKTLLPALPEPTPKFLNTLRNRCAKTQTP